MAAEAKHRDAIVAAAANLFRRRGFAATGMNDIVAESGAPKGSVYHYFPAGKGEIGVAALLLAGRITTARLTALAADRDGPAVFFRRMAAGVAKAMSESGYRNGCPIAGVVLDSPPDDARTMQAAEEALEGWRRVILDVCGGAGIAADRAAFLASVAISLVEGAMLQARIVQTGAPLEAAGEALATLAEAMLAVP